MTDSDQQWQDRITKVVRRVAKDLIANDESEISEVIRRRLFEDLGNDRIRKNVAKVYADWCFEKRAQLPPEWTAVDTTATEAKAREYLRGRFEVCYPFHPATLSVFQRKWQVLPQYQQTRGTLAMLAQWVSWTFREGYEQARREPVITLGSAPLEVENFRAVIWATWGRDSVPLFHIAMSTTRHWTLTRRTAPQRHRVGTTSLFESSGGK
jgi:predicted AAA+ superfamily ATPase